jgi:hypothetical protein
MNLTIGQTVWKWDENRRVYPKDENGKTRMSSAPIWREHWRPMKIVGETSRSWITDHDDKLPKSGPAPLRWCFSEEEIDRAAYIADNRHRICEEVRRIDDYETLRKVADLIGYRAEYSGDSR